MPLNNKTIIIIDAQAGGYAIKTFNVEKYGNGSSGCWGCELKS